MTDQATRHEQTLLDSRRTNEERVEALKALDEINGIDPDPELYEVLLHDGMELDQIATEIWSDSTKGLPRVYSDGSVEPAPGEPTDEEIERYLRFVHEGR